MLKLKTLKDLHVFDVKLISSSYHYEQGKQFAKEWAKDAAREWLKSNSPYLNQPQDLEGWIKHFFDLDEEDLK